MATSVESRPRVRVAERPQARGAGRDVVRRRLFLALVAVLPLHTLFVDAWVSWKPYMLLLGALVLIDVWQGGRAGRWPWDLPASLALVALLAAALAGWPPAAYLARYLALVLALVVGALLLLVTARSLRSAAMLSATLRVIFWTGAAMGITALGLTLASMGAFGAGVVPFINAIPGIDRVAKMAYLEEGFLALTNWHQDPGYAASWMTLWAGLGLVASVRGLGTRRWWGDGAILGGLVFGVMMTFSRTGWLGLVVGLAFVTWVLVRSGEATLGQMAKRLAAAGLVALLLVGVVWANDDPDAGGHLDVQFAFRLGQVWQLANSTLNLSGGDVAFAEVFDDSEGRADVWPDYLELFRSHPWTGVGLGVGWETVGSQQEPHNLLLELLAETGLLGVVAFLVLLAVLWRRGGGVAGTVALVLALLPILTQTVLFEMSWWFAAGVLLAGGRASLEETPSPALTGKRGREKSLLKGEGVEPARVP